MPDRTNYTPQESAPAGTDPQADEGQSDQLGDPEVDEE